MKWICGLVTLVLASHAVGQPPPAGSFPGAEWTGGC